MSGGLKQQWGVGDPAQVGPDPQSQDLKAAFEKPMDAMAGHLQFTAVNGEPARHDPFAARSEALVPRYQTALGEVDPADAAKAKASIDSLLADAEALGKEVEAFRNETEKAVAEWQGRVGAYDAAVVQVEELQEWQHPKEAAVRALADAIRGFVNDRAHPKAIALLDQFLPKLQPVYEDLQKQKAAQKEYEPALTALQPRLAQAAQPSFVKLASQQAEIATGQTGMASSATERDFVSALAESSALGGKVDAYTAAVEELTRLKKAYEQALAQVQPKLQAAPNPSPFQKLASQQGELASGQQQMESAAQAEDFEQALSQANDLGTKADAYAAAVEELTRLKKEYEQALAQVQPKLQTAPNPSPFNKLAAQQAELTSGQQQMESAAQAEEFEQALSQANDLGTKADAYTAAVAELTRLKQEYEQALSQVQPKLQAAPNPSPFDKLTAQQAELSSGQQQMEAAAQAEEFEQALQQANDLGTKADAYTTAVEELTRLKTAYEQALAQVQPKVQAAPNPSPFNKLAPQQAELASAQQQMESSAQAEEFEQALSQANDLGAKADAYTTAVEELTRLKTEYEQVLAQVQPKVQAAPNPSPFNKLAAQQAELTSGQQQMESSAQAEEFEPALSQANDLGAKADAYTAAVEELTRLKSEYEQALAQVQPKVQAAPSPSPFNKLAAQQTELTTGQQQMESSAQAEEFEQALSQANDLSAKADAYTAAVEEMRRLKQEYEQALVQVQPKLQAAPNPSPFNKLAPQQAELTSGQQQMESAAQGEEFEQALSQANDLGAKADAYTAAVEELTRLKTEYEQVLAQVQPKLQAAPNPSPFNKLAAQQAELTSGQQQMETTAQAEDFEQALQQANDLGTKVDAYTAAVEELTRLKTEYEQALAQVQPKLQAAPNPSPFNKLAPQQAELAAGQQQMESAAQAEEFEQALQQANELVSKDEAYTAAVEELTRFKQEYDQALAQVQPKLQAAPNPSPFNKLAPQQAELTSGQQHMESAAQAEEFEQALQQANDLGAKADAYTAAVEELTRLKQEYEQALAQVQPKLQAAPNPSPFNKLAAQQAELTSGQQQMESAAQSEDFEQALQQANDLGSKVDAYTTAAEELTRLKTEYEQSLAQAQTKLQAAPNPSPFNKLTAQQAELASGQQQMESAARSEEFEQALQQANDLGTKVDAYTAAVEELTRLKTEYEQTLGQTQPKLQAAPNPSPFERLAPRQVELASLQQQMESAAQSEDFEQALQKAADLGTLVDAYTPAVTELKRLKETYEQALAQLEPKLRAAPNPSPSPQLAPMQAALVSGEQKMNAAAQAEDFQQALDSAGELDTKVDAYGAEVDKLKGVPADPAGGEPAVEFTDEVQLGPGSQLGKVVLGTSFRNSGGVAIEAGLARLLVQVVDQKGAVVHSLYGEPSMVQLEPKGTTVAWSTAALREGSYGVRLVLSLDGHDVATKTGALEVRPQTVDLRAGKPVPVAPPADDRVPDLKWDGEIEPAPDSVAGKVTLGCRYRNDSNFSSQPGVAQGFLTVLDNRNRQIASGWLEPVGEILPGAKYFCGGASALKLDPGVYGVKLSMTVLSKGVGQEKVCTLEVDAHGVTVRGGVLPPTTPDKQLEIDDRQIAMKWTGEIDLSLVNGSDFSIAHPFRNAGPEEIELGWIQGKISPQVLANGAYTGEHFMECLVPTLKPGAVAPMHYVGHLPNGQYKITLTLQKTHEILDTKVGYLSIVEKDGNCEARWSWSAPKVEQPVASNAGEREEGSDAAYEAAVAAGKWVEAARALEKFKTDDIKGRLAKLNLAQAKAIRQAALDDPGLGPQSMVALLAEPVAKKAAPADAEPDPRADGVTPGGDKPLRSDEDQKAGDSLSTKEVTQADREKQTDDAATKALGKAGEAALKQFLQTKDGKRIQAAAEKELEKIPAVVKYGVPAALIATAIAGLAKTHGESPVTESPDIPLPDLGAVKVTAKITWEGPVDKPTKSSVTFNFEVPLGKRDPEKKPTSDADKIAEDKRRLEEENKKFQPKQTEEPPPVSGKPLPPSVKAGGPSTLVDNFDVSKGKGKIAMNLDRMGKAIHQRTDGRTGRLRVIGYWWDPVGDDEEKRTRQVGINQDRATDNARQTAAALQEWFKPHFVGRIDSQALEARSANTFGLAGSDAEKLGTHEVAVIFVP